MVKDEESITAVSNKLTKNVDINEDISKKSIIKAYRIPMIGGVMHYGIASELTTPTPAADASVSS